MADLPNTVTESIEHNRSKSDPEDALAEARKSEEHFRTMLSTIPTLAWCSTAGGSARFFSQRWHDYTGLTFNDAKGNGWMQAIHPDDRKSIADRWLEIMRSEKPGEAEARFRRYDGEYRWHLFRAAPLIDGTGTVTRWYGTNADIDDLKRTEAQLRRSKVFLEHAQKLSHTGSVGLRVADGEIFWSAETARIYGYDPTVLPTVELILQRVHPDDQPLLRDVFARALKGDANFDFVHRLVMPDGTIKYIRNFAQSVKDDSGQEDVLGAVMDITERIERKKALKDALARVKKSEVELRGLVEAMPAHVWCIFPNGSAQFNNQRGLDFFGLTNDQASHWDFRNVLHPDDADRVITQWNAILSSGQFGEAEMRLRRSDGEYCWFLIRAVPVWDANGHITKWYGTNTDINDLKRAESILAGEKKLYEMIATGHTREDILNSLCRIAEDLTGNSRVAIFLVDDEENRLRLCAAPNFTEAYRNAIDGELIGPSSGPCGTAAFRKENVFATDIAQDQLQSTSKDLALANGFHSLFATPIVSSSGNIAGSLVVSHPGLAI